MTKLLCGRDALIHYRIRNQLYFEKLFGYCENFCECVTNDTKKVSRSKNRRVRYVKFTDAKDFKDGKFVSPEFLFFLVSKDFPFFESLIFGIEIISQKLTTKRKILHFVSMMKGNCGSNNAFKVCNYLGEGSESIMESILFAMFVLPQHKGGFGIKNIIMNKKIEIPKSIKTLSYRSFFIADFFIPNTKLTLEYDSTAFHSDRESLYLDAAKRNITELLGYEVITIVAKQLYSYSNRMAIFLIIMKKINRRVQIRSKSFLKNNKKIADLFPKIETQVWPL